MLFASLKIQTKLLKTSLTKLPQYTLKTMDQAQNSDHKPPRRVGERDAFVGKWLKMKYIDFEVRGKTIKNYEMIERTTRRSDTPYDGVAAYSIIKSDEGYSQLVIIANYRAPVDRFVLEIPAGLMDSPNMLENAIRELKEETGYIANKEIKVQKQEPPPIYPDPWRSCSCSKAVFLEIDGNLPENKNPKQELEQDEYICVHLLKIDGDMADNLITLAEKNNYIISAGLWSFAQGISFAKKFLI